MAFANGSQTHHDSKSIRIDASLVGVPDQTGIADCCAFDRAFMGKRRSQQLSTFGGDVLVNNPHNSLCVTIEQSRQVVVSTRKALDDVRHNEFNFLLTQGHHFLDSVRGTRLTTADELLTWDEESSDYPRDVSQYLDVGAFGNSHFLHRTNSLYRTV
jgi:hypothetical protein